MASEVLRNLRAAVSSGDPKSAMTIGEELMVVSGGLPDRNRYQVLARHYLSMAQISLGRHDRAVDQVSRMLSLARESGDEVLQLRSMATLGRVHLSFGHLDAAARAWERLVPEVDNAVPKSWLLHEIGRCYFEMRRPAKALETARRCVEYAEEGNSGKWLMHGKLLSGQALVQLGRLGEAVEVLGVAADAARVENDRSTVEYVEELIDRVTRLLRRDVCPDEAETKGEGVERDDAAWRTCSKSADALGGRVSFELNLHGSSGRTAESRIVTDPLARRQPTKGVRTRKARARVQRRRKDIRRMESSVPTIQPSGSETFDLRTREVADPTGSSTKIGRSGRRKLKTEPPRRRRGDVDPGDLLTFRTRVISKGSPKHRNSRDGNDLGEKRVSRSGSEKSDDTGVTFVVDELRKFSILIERNRGTADADVAELFHGGLGKNYMVRLCIVFYTVNIVVLTNVQIFQLKQCTQTIIANTIVNICLLLTDLTRIRV